jgi:hypothetical protein
MRHGLRQHGLLQRLEHARIAGSRVHRADERDDEQRPERRRGRKSRAGRRHQRGCGDQQPPARMPVRDQTHPQREQRGADQRGRHDRADRQRTEADLDQVDRQQQRDESVGEGAHAAHRENPQRIGGSPGRHQPPPLVARRHAPRRLRKYS